VTNEDYLETESLLRQSLRFKIQIMYITAIFTHLV